MHGQHLIILYYSLNCTYNQKEDRKDNENSGVRGSLNRSTIELVENHNGVKNISTVEEKNCEGNNHDDNTVAIEVKENNSDVLANISESTNLSRGL